MAIIKDAGQYWELEIYPDSEFVEYVDEPDKGYRAALGFDQDTFRHVVSHVFYRKDMYPIGEVLKKIDGMKACPKCDALDKSRLDSVSIQVPTPQIQQRRGVPAPRTTESPEPVQDQSIPVRRNVKDLFTNALFDAYLTPAGKMMIGNVFGDENLVRESMPQNDQELAELWDDTTKGRLVRSPESASEFMNVLRTGATPQSPEAPKKKGKFIQNIVIG